MHIKSVFFICFGMFFLFVSHAGATGTQAKEIVATGVADGTSAKARDEAVNDALRKAVEQGVGTSVTTELTVEQQKLVEEKIYTASSGYIQRYRILQENKEDGLFEVEISALVKMGKLADDLKSIGLILKKKQNPRVMVVLYSKMRSGSFIDISLEGNRNAENQVERMLMKRGFQLVDADQTKRRRELEDRLATGDPKSAGRLAKDYGAEILITGEVSRIFAGTRSVYGSNVRFFSNDIRMKALETDTAKILFSGYRTGPASSADALFYLEESIEELFEEMVEGIFEQWRKDVYKAGLYQVRVANVSFKNLSQLKKSIRQIRGVGAIHMRNFQSGTAAFEIEYQGTMEAFGEKLVNLKTLPMEVTGLQANTLEVRITK